MMQREHGRPRQAAADEHVVHAQQTPPWFAAEVLGRALTSTPGTVMCEPNPYAAGKEREEDFLFKLGILEEVRDPRRSHRLLSFSRRGLDLGARRGGKRRALDHQHLRCLARRRAA